MIIDIHVHCYPDEVAARSIAARSEKFGIRPETDGTLAGLKRSMDRAGVDISVLQPIALKPEQTVKMNRWAASRKEEGILSFGTIHPDYAKRKQEIQWLVEHGFKGVKFHADCQGYYVDDPRMLELYEAIFNAGLVILFHSGVDKAFSEPFHCTPFRLRKVLDTFPGGVMIAAHMGGYDYWEDADKYLVGRKIYFDTAYSIHSLGLERAERMIRDHGPGKVLFGTDSPWRDPAMDIALIRSLHLKEEEIIGILGNNAKEVLGL